MVFGKKPINCKAGDLGETRSIYSQTNALTGKNCAVVVYTGSVAFMVPELIIEELSIATAGIELLLCKICKKLKMCKNKKRPGFYTLTENIFINNSRSKQNFQKKFQTPFCRHC